MSKKKKPTTKQRQIKQNNSFLVVENQVLRHRIKELENKESNTETGKRPQTPEQRQKQVASKYKNKKDELEKKVKILEEENADLSNKLEKALLMIEELQRCVFRGKKKNEEDDKSSKVGGAASKKKGKKKRDKISYRRPIPKEEEITHIDNSCVIENCPRCNTKLTKTKILEFYVQDIVPMIDWAKNLKTTTKKRITTGYCSGCAKRVSSTPIPKQRVTIGNNIRQLIVFQYTIQQLSYSQIIDFAKVCLKFELSNGDVINILEDQAKKLRPAFENLLQSLRSQPAVHIDETSWKLAFNDEYSGNYAWAAAGIMSDDVVYRFGQNRGKGNVEEILGTDYEGFIISDDYGAYTNTNSAKNGKHGLCWAHPHRKFRDLKNSGSLEDYKRIHCDAVYRKFLKLYKKVQRIREKPFVKEERLREKKVLMKKFEFFCKPHKNDPEKLATIKNTLLEKKERYFICITEPNIPADNNKAERVLRHLVIKRKKSLGSKTKKGADILSIIYSVVMSLWYRSKKELENNFFENYKKALRPLN